MSNPLGPWKDDDLRATAASNGGMGADSDLPEEARFVGAVAKLVRRRLMAPRMKTEPSAPAVFLLSPEGPDGVVTKRVPMLASGRDQITGRVWFVSAVAASGRWVPVEAGEDDDALFRFVVDELRLGEIPAVVFDPQSVSPEIRFYPRGMAFLDEVDVRALELSGLSLEYVLGLVDSIYKRNLITPDAQPEAGKTWANARKWWPHSNAERVVQMYLHVGLATALPTCTVRPEQTGRAGRLDLEIEESDPGDPTKFVRHAILELKVLRTYRASGTPVPQSETDDWVRDGIAQAAAYRVERGARASALCCFDMRKNDTGDTCFAQVRELASELAVELRIWYLFASSALYRKQIFSGGLGGGGNN